MNTALLIIDMQNDYFQGGKMELAGTAEAALNCQTLLAAFRTKGLPVFHVRHEAVQPGATFFLPGSEGARIHDSLVPLAGEAVITKHFPSAFRDTGLNERLKQEGITRLVVCGAMSHMCIDTSVRAAFDLGYEILVAVDACATRDLEFAGQQIPAVQVHGAYMAALGAVFAKVLPAADLLVEV